MLIAYDSRTGNVRRLIKKLDLPAVQITPVMVIDEPFIMATYTTGFGQVPEKVAAFLKLNHQRMTGVIASGNRNWGDGFAKSADRIARYYSVPILGKFELSGSVRDIEQFHQEVRLVAAY